MIIFSYMYACLHYCLPRTKTAIIVIVVLFPFYQQEPADVQRRSRVSAGSSPAALPSPANGGPRGSCVSSRTDTMLCTLLRCCRTVSRARSAAWEKSEISHKRSL